MHGAKVRSGARQKCAGLRLADQFCFSRAILAVPLLLMMVVNGSSSVTHRGVQTVAVLTTHLLGRRTLLFAAGSRLMPVFKSNKNNGFAT